MSTRDSIANSDSPNDSSSVSNRSLRAVPGKLLGERSQARWILMDAVKNERVTRRIEGALALRFGGRRAKTTPTEAPSRQRCRLLSMAQSESNW
jgi:hypothetical protein